MKKTIKKIAAVLFALALQAVQNRAASTTR